MKHKTAILYFAIMLLTTGACSQNNNAITNETENVNKMNIKIGNTILTATLADNSSVDALKSKFLEGAVTIQMKDYATMEKVGPLGFSLPRNDEQIDAVSGDIILYQGNSLVIYYDTNSWNFTRIGKIDDISQKDLKEILGKGSVTVTLSLSKN